MAFQEGESLPDYSVYEFDTDKGPVERRLPDLAYKKKVVAIGVPGAFTPVCSEGHLPGYLMHHQDFMDMGVDEIWCIAVNDAFVLNAWAKDLHVDGKVRMLGDGSAELVRAMDITLDLTAKGMGVRSDRFAMVIDNGQITHFLKEEPGHFMHTDAASVLEILKEEVDI
ncbi:peroxiredoxin [Parendozoicomonas sp. Alg238-R29]|uniref:peroxiredoxin family protein n=1 Tax=Parendozoicomonas sp. Alg238-R29 TaxID=2993446 RepID=UPI00248EE571|nr:peroxiredoxin [Parendozoicomonas sp. Alg238-R29]